MKIYFLLLLTCLLLLDSQNCIAGTGIVEVNSEPSGAKVYLNGTYVGKTPYSNPEVSIGAHKVEVYLSNDYPAQHWDFTLDDITPQTKKFFFSSDGGGKFTGIEEEAIVKKYLGNVQFASIPTGADVYINGKKKKTTPVGFRDVNVGHYEVKFILNDKTISGDFTIVKEETIKLIADFENNVLINRWHEEQLKQIDKRKAQKAKEELAAKKARAAQLEADRKKPRKLFSGNLDHGFRDLLYSIDVQVPLDPQLVIKYKLPSNTITIRTVKTQSWEKDYKNQRRMKAWYVYPEISCGPFKAEKYYWWDHNLRKWKPTKNPTKVAPLLFNTHRSDIKGVVVIQSLGVIKINLNLAGKHILYKYKDRHKRDHSAQPNTINGTVTLFPY